MTFNNHTTRQQLKNSYLIKQTFVFKFVRMIRIDFFEQVWQFRCIMISYVYLDYG